jgi:hypothetical protein
MHNNKGDSFPPPGRGRWWSRMSRHEQIIAAIIGAVLAGIFGILTVLISSSLAASNGKSPRVGGASSPPVIRPPTTSGAATVPTSVSPTTSPTPVIKAPSSPLAPGSSNTQYLAGLIPVSNSGSFETGSAEVNGTNYLNSVILDIALGGSYSVAYNAGRQWRILKATVGLRDDSPENETYEFQVFADGHPIYSHLFTLGQSQHVRLNITGALRLELRATLSSSSFYGEAYGVWGNAYLAR